MKAGDRRLDGETDILAGESETTADCRAMPRITAHDNHCDQPQRRVVQGQGHSGPIWYNTKYLTYRQTGKHASYRFPGKNGDETPDSENGKKMRCNMRLPSKEHQ